MAVATRPSFLQWASIGLVAAGGAVGAACREALSLWIPSVNGVPIAIAIINVIGAFLLGYLYEGLTRLPKGDKTVGRLKLLLGTGFCGGFTTYSSLATDTAVLNSNGDWGWALLYSLGTVIVGALATLLGIVIASRANEHYKATHPAPAAPAADSAQGAHK